ncbi:hypothetical protein MOP89_03210 [Enterococcus gallinarum]|nr:hypothetical protein [Enterococcus gallinarum]
MRIRTKKVIDPVTPIEAYQSIKGMVQGLMKAGYKLPEVLNMTLKDLELFNEILDESSEESELTEDFLDLLM